ncbi:MAG: Fmu (Sun) domain-containing protein [Chitinophagaceae bacterium]
MQSRFQSYISVAHKLIDTYKGEIPLAAYLKNYFSQNKKHGSTDRKQISHLCYCYYRIGGLLADADFNERLKLAYFLCNYSPKEFAFLFDDDWLSNWNEAIDERINFVQKKYAHLELEKIFKWYHLTGISNRNIFIRSHLIQPSLFLRVRNGFENKVQQKLQENKIEFATINANSLSLNNGSRIEDIIKINNEAVVQDYSSQQIATMMELVKKQFQKPIDVWDCCAASGGKSILAVDVFGEINLTVSDIRASIIANLKKRFEAARIKKYQAFVADISKPVIIPQTFDFIICDVPCTGSGTWSRTPEQLHFFKEEPIDTFSLLQKNIVTNTLDFLRKNGYFLYITCSVFKKENDEVVDFLMKHFKLEIISKKYFEGYEMKADSMFATLFKKLD